MLLKLILIICLLVSASMAIKVNPHNPAKFTDSPIISGSSGNTGANPCYGHEEGSKDPAQFTDSPITSATGSGSGCPHHHRKDDDKSGGKKDTSVEQPKQQARFTSGGRGSSGSGCGASGTGTATGTGGRTTAVNDGVTYKSNNLDGEGGEFESTGCGEITGW